MAKLNLAAAKQPTKIHPAFTVQGDSLLSNSVLPPTLRFCVTVAIRSQSGRPEISFQTKCLCPKSAGFCPVDGLPVVD
jgi:hypothetical protein